MAWAKYLEVQYFWCKIPSQEVPPTPVIKHETGSFSSYHHELQPASQVSGVEQEVETQHQYSYAEYEDQEYTRGEDGVRIMCQYFLWIPLFTILFNYSFLLSL